MTPEIKSKVRQQIDGSRYHDNESIRLALTEFATFGYSLAEGEIAASEEIIKLLQDSEDYLRAEIERLKGLLKKSITNKWINFGTGCQEQKWQQFKTNNNL
jgi:hypothetical protein